MNTAPPPASAPRVRALLFDMDGLLVDTERLHLTSFAHVASSRGVSCDWHDLKVWIGKGQHRLATWIVEQGGEGDVEAILDHQRREFLARLEAERPGPQPGVAELLVEAEAAGLARGLVSNSDRGLVMPTMASALGHLERPADPTETFGVVVTRDDVVHPKPAPDPYLAAAEALGVAPRECLVFEDSPSGVEAAVAAGCRVVAVPCPYLEDPEPMRVAADFACESLLEVVALRLWE